MAELYSDPLVVIRDDGIRIRRYSLLQRDKTIPWSEIEKVRALLPTWWNGRWRLWGTGNMSTWFALDFGRPARETIFVLHRRGRWVRIGFTVHDARRVKEILAERRVLVDEQGDELPLPLPSDDRPMWRWGALWAVVILLAALVGQAVYYHPQLPERVATHFNAAGRADRWGHKATLVTVMLAVTTFNAGVFIVVAYMMHKSPAAIIGRYVLWIGAAVAAFMLVLSELTYRANFTDPPVMPFSPLWALGALLLAIFAILGRMLWRLW